MTILALVSCSSSTNSVSTTSNTNEKLDAVRTINSTIQPLPHATLTTSQEIDWPVGVIPWDRFTLPVIAPSGLFAAVQLGAGAPHEVVIGHANDSFNSTTISIHPLDPSQGVSLNSTTIDVQGLLLSRAADEIGVFVEAPRGDEGRWIGRIDWKTGILSWIISDEAINAFPTVNNNGEIAWSRRPNDEDRFHLVAHMSGKIHLIDDGKSDWLFPVLLKGNRLRAYRLLDGRLSIVELDLLASNPMLTAISYVIIEDGATRQHAWQIATTNPYTSGSRSTCLLSIQFVDA